MSTIFMVFSTFAAVFALALVTAIVFGGPARLSPLKSVNDPFKLIDFSGLPPIERFIARDGTQLAYRTYEIDIERRNGCVVLVHGSSASSNSMHAIAKGIALSGYVVYALDIRGHGESGEKGQIAYVGQLEDDIEDFMKCLQPKGRKVLVGFSAGGGFALRFAADVRRSLFDGFVLLSPFLSQRASTYRPDSGGWVSVGLLRIIGLMALNRFGISALNRLPVTSYALTPEAAKLLTPAYSYALAMNFRPNDNYQADIASAVLPMEVLVGGDDDQFYAERFATEFSSTGWAVPVSILPGTGHIAMTLDSAAIEAAVQAVSRVSHALENIQKSVWSP
jgi:alpha-beta hydrolase superfamily lysophospholipase